MATQTEGSPLALRSILRPQIDLCLVGWLMVLEWLLDRLGASALKMAARLTSESYCLCYVNICWTVRNIDENKMLIFKISGTYSYHCF
jgi:hypothetical protein